MDREEIFKNQRLMVDTISDRVTGVVNARITQERTEQGIARIKLQVIANDLSMFVRDYKLQEPVTEPALYGISMMFYLEYEKHIMKKYFR